MSADELIVPGPVAPPPGSEPELRRRLESTERRRRRAARGVQVVIFAGICCLGGLVAGGVDYLVPLPALVRAGWLTLTLVVAARRSFRVRRLNRRYRISELAARVEVELPGLEDRLVTAAELAEGRLQAPPEARARLYRDALGASTLPAVSGAAVNQREYAARRWLVPVLLVILVGAIAPEGTGRHALRFLLPFLKVDPLTATRLHHPGEYVVVEGDDARIAVEVSGVIPDHATLLLSRGADRMEPKPMSFLGFTPNGRARFEYVVAKPAASFECEIAAGDAVSSPIAVTVLERPRVEAATLRLTPPRYLGRPAETGSPGPVRVYAGTVLTWSGRTAPAGIRWQLFYQQEDGQRVMVGEGAGPELLASHRPRTPGQWTLTLAGEHGVRVRPWAEVPVELIPDLPPAVTSLRPPLDLMLPPSATVPLAIRATDDLGLAAVRLVATVNGGESRTLRAWTGVGPDTPVTEQPLEHELPLRDLGVRPGDIIAWRGWAADWNEFIPGGQVGMSPERFILIVPEEFVGDQPANAPPELQAAVDDLFGLIEDQTALLRKTEAASRQGALTPAERAQLQAEQALLQERAAALAAALGDLAGRFPVTGQMAPAVEAAAAMMGQAEGALTAGQPGDAMNPERQALGYLNRALQFVRLSRGDNARMQRNHELGTEPDPGNGSRSDRSEPNARQPGGRSGRQPGGSDPGAGGPSDQLGQLAEAARELANRLGRGRAGNPAPSLTAGEAAALRKELNSLLDRIEGMAGTGQPTPNAEMDRARALVGELRPLERNLGYAPSGAIIRHLEEVAAILTRESSISIGSSQAAGGSDPAAAEAVPPEYRSLVRDYYWRLSQ